MDVDAAAAQALRSLKEVRAARADLLLAGSAARLWTVGTLRSARCTTEFALHSML